MTGRSKSAAQSGRRSRSAPLEPGPHIGPVVNKRQWDQIQGYIQKGIDEGARLVAGGPGLPEGFNRASMSSPRSLPMWRPA
jgi:aldehyde dehydrogenase (NAD+)